MCVGFEVEWRGRDSIWMGMEVRMWEGFAGTPGISTKAYPNKRVTNKIVTKQSLCAKVECALPPGGSGQ